MGEAAVAWANGGSDSVRRRAALQSTTYKQQRYNEGGQGGEVRNDGPALMRQVAGAQT